MPAFFILVLIGAVLLFLCLSAFYRPVGRIFGTLFDDAKKAMLDEQEDEE